MTDREVNVTVYAGYKGGERPKSFIVEGKIVEIIENVERWIEEDKDTRRRRRFFLVKGSDEKVYTLYFDEHAQKWHLQES